MAFLRDCFQLCCADWAMAPSEFYRLTVSEFYWLLARRLPKQAAGGGPQFSRSDFELLIAHDKKVRAQHGK